MRIVLALALVAFVSGCGGGAATRPHELKEIVGTVKVNMAPARPGPLPPGATIEVDVGSECHVVLDDGNDLWVRGIQEPASLTVPAGESTAAHLVKLAKGAVKLAVRPAQPPSRYEVETANCTASVEGTKFVVSREGELTRVVVWQGQVRVKSREGEELVAAKLETTVDAAGAVAKPHPCGADDPVLGFVTGAIQPGRTVGNLANPAPPPTMPAPARAPTPAPPPPLTPTPTPPPAPSPGPASSPAPSATPSPR